MRITFLSSALVTLLFLWGCATLEYTFTEYGGAYKRAVESYKVGDLDGAVRNLVISLTKKPNYEKASLLLKEVAPKAYEKHKNKAIEHEQKEEWDEAVAEYDALLGLAKMVSSLGSDYPKINVQAYAERREIAVQSAAEAHYKRGISLMEEGEYKKAAKEFKRSLEFVPGYKNAESLYVKSREKALVRVAVMSFENRTGKTQFGDVGALLTDQIISTALNLHPEFIEFVTRDYLNQLIMERHLGEMGDIEKNPSKMGKLLGINAFVFGKVLSLVVNYPPTTSTSYDRETTIYRSEDEGGSYTVHATVTYYKRKGEVTITASFQIISASTGTIMKSDTIEASVMDEVRWARYSGDSRALTSEDKRFCAQGERPLRPEGVLVNNAVDRLSKRLAEEIINFFK